MKTLLLFFPILVSVQMYGQDFCTYNSTANVNFGDNSIDEPFETIELEDGKFLIIGTAYFSSSNSFRMAACRMNADNTIDDTFGSNGRIQYTWDGRNTGISAALQSDGKILVGGYQAPSNGISGFRPYVGRLNANGSIDTSFGDQGSARLEIETAIKGSVIGIRELNDGKILVATIINNPAGFALIRLMPDGSYDTSFNETGYALHQDTRVIWQVDFGDALFINDGSVIIVTKTSAGSVTKGLVAKLNPDGSLNQDFGESGTLEIETPIQFNFAGIHAALDNDGQILVASTSEESPRRYQVARILSDVGLLDADFGIDGVAASTNAASLNAVHGITLHPATGDIYVIGSGSASNWNHSLWKLDSSGNEQNICSGPAFYTFPVNPNNGLRTAAFYSDGSLKLVGEGSELDPTNPDILSQNQNWSILQFSDPLSAYAFDSSELLVYPNPATNTLNIEFPNHSPTDITIKNQLGQTIQTFANPTEKVDVSVLAQGIYFIEITFTGGSVIRKFVKN